LAVIQSQVSTFLPPDPLIVTATEFSGVPTFIELIDVDATRQIPDPFKERILALINKGESHGVASKVSSFCGAF
jgi:hypothetical protein